MPAASAACLNQALEPTANSVRSAPAVGGGSAPALGPNKVLVEKEHPLSLESFDMET